MLEIYYRTEKSFIVETLRSLTLSGPGFEKLAQTGGGMDSAPPPPLNSTPLYPNQTKFTVDKYNMTSPCAKCQVFWL